MKLQVGKKYRNRKGECVELVYKFLIATGDARYKDANETIYYDSGIVYPYEESTYDLIAPWEESPEENSIEELTKQIGEFNKQTKLQNLIDEANRGEEARQKIHRYYDDCVETRPVEYYDEKMPEIIAGGNGEWRGVSNYSTQWEYRLKPKHKTCKECGQVLPEEKETQKKL
jgi:hypothetical protein